MLAVPSAAAAAARHASRAAAAAAAAAAVPAGSLFMRRARSGSSTSGGLVAGQDTPVSEENLPEHMKSSHSSVVQAPASDQPSCTGKGSASGQQGQEGRWVPHPGPADDMYSGGDPQQAQESGAEGGSGPSSRGES